MTSNTDKLRLIFDRMPEPRHKRVAEIARICGVQRNTVRIWKMHDTHRPIPDNQIAKLLLIYPLPE